MSEYTIFACQDCRQEFVLPGEIEPPDYCDECEREIRLDEGRRSGSAGSGMSRVSELAADALMRVHELYEQATLAFEQDGYVYLLGGEGYYKIGRAKNVSHRLRSLKIQLPWPVHLEHTIPCEDYAAAEAALHERYADKRANGEWFALDEADVAEIKAIRRMRGRRAE